MCLQHRPSLVQIMARRLYGVKPLSEPMLVFCQLDPWLETSVKFNQNQKILIQENAFEIPPILSQPSWVDKWLKIITVMLNKHHDISNHQQVVQANIKENSKDLHCWLFKRGGNPLVTDRYFPQYGEIHSRFPTQRPNNLESVSMSLFKTLE